MHKGLVSILTPCYNSGTIIRRLLDSVLMQDYPMVEMFCIDDGSTDSTREFIEVYIPRFAERGYSLKYVYQDNSGQSVAINNGLKFVNGEFLMWPDSDDFYTLPDIISRMVRKIHEGDYDIGRCMIKYVDETNLHFISEGHKPLHNSTDQFENILYGKGGIEYPPVAFILRMKSLDETIPGREIYTEKRAGQNWQLMLPLSFHRKMFFLDCVGACVLVRRDSHSRKCFSCYETALEKQDVYRMTILDTIRRMHLMTEEEKNIYSNKIEKHYLHIKMQLAVSYGKSDEAVHYMNEEIKLTGRKYPIVNSLICRYCSCTILLMILRGIRKLLKISA